MTRCEAFYRKCKQFLDSEKIEQLEKFCKKDSEWTVWSIKRYIDFCTKYSLAMAHVSERALRPLIALEGTPHQDKIQVIVTLLNQIPTPTQNDIDGLIKSNTGLPSE